MKPRKKPVNTYNVELPLSNYGQVLSEAARGFRDLELSQLPEQVTWSFIPKDPQELYLVGLVLQQDGAFLLVYRGSEDAGSPLHGVKIEARFAHQILAWNNKQGRESARETLLQAANLDDASVLRKRNEVLAAEDLTDTKITERRTELLKAHGLTDPQIADKRAFTYKKHGLDDASIARQRELLPKEKGLV